MSIRFRLQYDNGIVTTGYIYIILVFTSLQCCCPLIFSSAQKAVLTSRMSNITVNSTQSYKTIPFQDCLCSIISINQCIDDEFFRECRVITLLLFVLLAYFISNTLISGNSAYIFVHLYWMFCFVCFFTILIVLHWRNYYYNEMSIVLIVIGVVQFFVYKFCTESI